MRGKSRGCRAKTGFGSVMVTAVRTLSERRYIDQADAYAATRFTPQRDALRVAAKATHVCLNPF